MAPLISDQTGSFMAWQWQGGNSEGQEGMFPTSHTWWPRSGKAWPGLWNPQIVTMRKQLLFTWAFPPFAFPPIAPLLFLGYYSSYHLGFFCVTWQQFCYLNQIDRNLEHFFPSIHFFCSMTGQKYHKLVQIEGFFDIWAVATFGTLRKKSRKQSNMESKLWDFAGGLLLPTAVTQSSSEQ